MQPDSPQKWKTLIILAICQALHFHRSYSPKIPTFFSRLRYSMCTNVSKNVGKLVNWRFLQAINKKKNNRPNQQTYLEESANITYLLIHFSWYNFRWKNICSILSNTLSSKCINCSSNKFLKIISRISNLQMFQSIHFWDTLYINQVVEIFLFHEVRNIRG